jgi:hypothetical protein
MGDRRSTASKPSPGYGGTQCPAIDTQQSLALLEYQLGATLFERTNGGTRPTSAGHEFLSDPATVARFILGS